MTNALTGKIFKKTCACDISVTIGCYDSGIVNNCFRSLWALMCGETHYSAFLDMLDTLAVGNVKTLDLLVPHKAEPITNIFPAYGPARRFYIKRGYIPDGKGVYYKEKVCETDVVCRNDDELTLCLAKEL